MGITRFALALVVLLFHTGSNVGGPFAVYAFYIMSGYVMTGAMESLYHSRVRAFYLSRLWRLLPVYLLSVIAIWGSATLVISFSHLHATNLPLVGSNLLSRRDVVIGLIKGSLPEWKLQLGSHPVLVAFFQWNNPYWTVIIELLFYSIVPLVILFQRSNKLVRSIQFFAFSFLVYLYYAQYVSQDLDKLNNYLYRNFFPTLVFFALGNLVFRLREKYILRMLRENNKLIGFGLIFILLFVASKPLFSDHPVYTWLFFQWLVAAVTFLYTLGIESDQKRNSRLSIYLGSLSYVIYVMQGFVINIPMYIFLIIGKSKYPSSSEFYWFGGWSRLEIDLYVVATSIAVAVVIERYLDRPINIWRHKPATTS